MGQKGEGRMNTTLKLKITVPASAGATAAAIEAPARGGSTNPREFLAMRARQKKAQARARRWRLSFLALAGAGMMVAAFGAPRWRHRAIAPAEASPILLEAPAAVPALAAASTAPLAEPAPAVAPIPATTEPTAPPAAPAVGTTTAPVIDARCQDDFAQRHWRSAIASCAQAFQAAPDAGVAMKLAHAYWSHDEVERAGKWASRAVALGTEDADAFVLIGHAEREAGNAAGALSAYRKYLRQAPSGWHAARVRAAVRELKAAQAADAPASASN
jgi:hypothetical protein